MRTSQKLKAAIGAVAAAQLAVQAQAWKAIPLHPKGASFSRVMAVDGAQQFGYVGAGAVEAIVWNQSNTNWFSLTPSPNEGGHVNAARGGVQGGDVNGRASLWFGTAQSRIDLHVEGAYYSEVLGVHAQQQVGRVVPIFAGGGRASLWEGTASSYVDLHPSGTTQSRAFATDGVQQGGHAFFPNGYHPMLWSGTAQSAVDLTPAGYIGGAIYSMVPGQQAGMAQHAQGGVHAALWSGTAQSFVNMTPPGAGLSFIYGTTGTAQAGYAFLFGIGNRAGVWFGTPESFISLADTLPSWYGESLATSITEHNGLYYVGGKARNLLTSRDEAFLWVGVPAPGTLSLLAAAAVLAMQRRR
jgi:hypothetical protein